MQSRFFKIVLGSTWCNLIKSMLYSLCSLTHQQAYIITPSIVAHELNPIVSKDCESKVKYFVRHNLLNEMMIISLYILTIIYIVCSS